MKRKIGMICILTVVLLAGCGSKEHKEEIKNSRETTAGPVEEDSGMSEKLSDFRFTIDGKPHVLPEDLKEWEKEGWMYQNDRDRILEGEGFLEGERLEKGGKQVIIDIVNTKTEQRAVKDSKAGMICLKEGTGPEDCRFPNNIILGSSGVEDVIRAYGKASDEYEEKEKIHLIYEFGVYQKAEFIFSKEDKLLIEVRLKNYREPLEVQEKAEKEVPPETAAYQAPEQLSGDLTKFEVRYGNDLYRLPAPVSEFLKNGWQVSPECADDVIKSGHDGYVTMERQEQTLYAVVHNYAAKTAVLENCFVLNVHGDFNITRVPVETGNGITLGISEEKVLELLKDIPYEVSYENDYGISYYIYADEEKKDYTRIFVDKELKLVREIEMSHKPDHFPEE